MEQHNQIKLQECVSRGWYKKILRYLCGVVQTSTRKQLKAEATFPEIGRYKSPSQADFVEERLPQQENLIHRHHDWLQFLSARMPQRPHGPCHHPLFLRHIWSVWSLPAQHLSAQDQSPSARLLCRLPPTLLCAWFLCVLMLAARQGLPCPRPERYLCFHLCSTLCL